MAHNINIRTEGTKIILEMDVSDPGYESSSGKSTILASTQGNKRIKGLPGDIRLSVNLYRELPKSSDSDPTAL